MYVVLKFKGEDSKIREIYGDDLIGRQTLIKRDAKSLGMEGKDVYLLVEGSLEAVEKAKEMATDFVLQGKEAEEIYKKIKESEEEASLGMGAIFG
jgi:hypothetical protein